MTQCNKAILFAGQGAQFVGMGRDLAESDPETKSLFSRANEILGYDLAGVCFNGPESDLLKSSNCQAAVFTVGVACWTALSSRRSSGDDVSGDAPGVFHGIAGAAGLSLGEWTALHMAGAISFDDALRVIHARGRFMQEACEERPGAMLSVIGLDLESVKSVAEEAGVETANINSPEQIVLSGERDGIMKAEKIAASAGAKRTVLLNVAGAYHSSLMAAAADKLAGVLRDVEFQAPLIPVISNVTGLPHENADDIRRNMALQVTSPVQWVSTIQWFERQGVSQYIECGPGRVLSGLVRRIHSQASVFNVQDAPSLDKTCAASG